MAFEYFKSNNKSNNILNVLTKTKQSPTTNVFRSCNYNQHRCCFCCCPSRSLGKTMFLYGTALRRKIRKTSRRKRKRRRNTCVVSMYNRDEKNEKSDNISRGSKKNTTNMVDYIMAAKTTTSLTNSKCKKNVNNRRKKTLTFSYINKNNNNNLVKSHIYCSSQRSRDCISNSKSSRNSLNKSNCCNCKCSRNKMNLIVNNIVTLLSLKTTTNLVTSILVHTKTAPTVTSARNIKTVTKNNLNNDKRKKVQLHVNEKIQQQQWQHQLKYLYALGKCVKIAKTTKQQQVETLTTPVTSPLLPTTTTSTSQTLSSTNSNNNYFSTTTPVATTTASRTSSPSSSSLSTWYSLTWFVASARILNELYGVLFMILLVLSICHNNVLETSAASIKIARRQIAEAASIGTIPTSASTPTIVPTPTSTLEVIKQIVTPSNGAENQSIHQQYPPEQITQSPQTHNHHQPKSQFSQKQLQQHQQLENILKNDGTDKTNHNFQPQIQPQSLPTYHNHYHERGEQQQEQQQEPHLTTQANSFSSQMILETTYNHTFQSLSIIDGGLTVAVDTSQNRMTVEEEMLIAAAGSVPGVGNSIHGLTNFHHENILRSHDSMAIGLTGINVMAHNAEQNSMPIFDFGMPRNITARTGHTEAIIKCRVDRLDDKSVSWIRKRDLHILTVGTATYTSDKRFQVTESKDSREWTLHIKSPQARDSGIYECQVNTEPKMSMAFQLNIIEISPDAKAIIMGPADLHFKVGSAIILTCIVHQPSVKDIGPIYWYRGEYMITPFDINDNDYKEPAYTSPDAVLANPTTQNKINVLEHNHLNRQYNNGVYSGGGSDGGSGDRTAASDVEQIPQILTNEITKDFAQRIAMESQLGDIMKSRLRISNAQKSDTGNYTCQPTTASSASVMVHVINDENPAAMQKSKASSFHNEHRKKFMPLLNIALFAIVASATVSLLNIICDVDGGNDYVEDVINIRRTISKQTATIRSTTIRKHRIILSCLRYHVMFRIMFEGIDLMQELILQQFLLITLWRIYYNRPTHHLNNILYNSNNDSNNNILHFMQSDYYDACLAYRYNIAIIVVVILYSNNSRNIITITSANTDTTPTLSLRNHHITNNALSCLVINDLMATNIKTCLYINKRNTLS